MAAVNPTEVSYQIPVAGTNPDYSYVYTYTGAGHGGGDTNLYFYLPPGELPAPASLTATAVSSSQINLTWGDSGTTEQGFKIERCTGAGCSNFAQIAVVGANVTSYSNTGLIGSTSYSYRVRAYNASGDSNYSNPASAVTQAAPAAPTAPTNLVATVISKSQVNLSWTDNADNETGFRIQRCKGSTCTNFAQDCHGGRECHQLCKHVPHCKHNVSLSHLRLQREWQFGLLERRRSNDTQALTRTFIPTANPGFVEASHLDMPPTHQSAGGLSMAERTPIETKKSRHLGQQGARYLFVASIFFGRPAFLGTVRPDGRPTPPVSAPCGSTATSISRVDRGRGSPAIWP